MCCFFGAIGTMRSFSSMFLYSPITNIFLLRYCCSQCFLNHCVMAGALQNVIPSLILVLSRLSYRFVCLKERATPREGKIERGRGGEREWEKDYESVCIVHASLLLCLWAHLCQHAFPCVCSSVSGWQ